MKMNQQILALRGEHVGETSCNIVAWEMWGK